MAMINCYECDKKISNKAISCPNCGAPMDRQGIYNEDTENESKLNLQRFKKTQNEISGIIQKGDVAKQFEEKINFWDFTGAKILFSLVVISILLSIISLFSGQYKTQMKEVDNTLRNHANIIAALQLGTNISEGIVTDKVVVQKAIFNINDDNDVYGSIDIRPQPAYTYKFLGQGSFDLTDREIKVMLSEVVTELNDYIGEELGRKDYIFTANNYPIGSYINGELELEGE